MGMLDWSYPRWLAMRYQPAMQCEQHGRLVHFEALNAIEEDDNIFS
jgi:hypothetical protein